MISRENFNNEDLCKDTVKQKILNFLKQNKQNAYTSREICNELKTNSTSTSINLSILEKEGLLSHKGKAKSSYWIFKEVKVDG